MNYPRVLLGALVVALLGSVIVAGVSSSAAFGAYNPSWDGTSDLRSIAAEEDAEPTFVRPGESLDSDGEDVALVLAPDESTDSDRLRTFLDAGGTVVIADDFGPDANRLLAGVNASARIDGRLLRDEQHHYRGPAMPRATNVSDSGLTRDVDALTLNYGTGVEPNGAQVLVRTSPYAYYDENRNGELDSTESMAQRPVATVESVSDGRVVTVGDPSLFINAMLSQEGNTAFARNLLDDAGELHILVAGDALPPLIAALLTLRQSALLQTLVGLSALGMFGAWVRSPGALAALRARLQSDQADPDTVLNETALAAAIRERHPEWSAERVERITTAIKNRRNEDDSNG